MHPFLVEISTMHPELRKTGYCTKADHMLQRLKLCRMSAEQEEHEFMQLLPRETSFEIFSLSSAEAEFYAAVKAAAAGIGCVSMMRDIGVMLQQQGVEVKVKGSGDEVNSPSLEIKLDATAGRAIAMRRGAGRIRHIATPTLWLRRLVINGDIKMTRSWWK